jgi:hypothetical protein
MKEQCYLQNLVHVSGMFFTIFKVMVAIKKYIGDKNSYFTTIFTVMTR